MKHSTRKQTALDRGRTDRITLTYDLDHQSLASYGRGYTHVQKFKVSSQSIRETEWIQTNGRTDGQKKGRRRQHYLLHF